MSQMLLFVGFGLTFIGFGLWLLFLHERQMGHELKGLLRKIEEEQHSIE